MAIDSAGAREISRTSHELRIRTVEVVRVEDLAPRLRRVIVGGAELAGFASDGPGDHVKAFFPAPGEQPVMPSIAADGSIVKPDGTPSPRRDFTPRSYDAQRNELTLEFVLHDTGPASDWARGAAPGASLGLAGPRGSKVYPLDYDWYLIGGDETAIPAIGRWLEDLPAGKPAIVLIEVDDERDEIRFETEADADIRWIHRNSDSSDEPLAAAVRAVQAPAGDGFAWFAGEAVSLRPVRRHVIDVLELPTGQLDISGYWKRGVVEHDHHEPVEG